MIGLVPLIVLLLCRICNAQEISLNEPNTIAVVPSTSTLTESTFPTIKEPATHHLDGAQEIPVTDNFFTSFATAFGMILFSELGDKTFLIAAILAMRHNRFTVFMATTSALALMTVISVVAGMILPTLMPRSFTKWVAAIMFLVFGALMVKEGWEMGEDHLKEEYDEVVHELEQERNFSSMSLENLESQANSPPADKPSKSASEILADKLGGCFGESIPPIAIQTFSMVFLAEWGDRSQLATIVLGAAQNPWGVALGASLGHAACSVIAVILGRALSKILSINTVTIMGGILFIAFAILTIF